MAGKVIACSTIRALNKEELLDATELLELGKDLDAGIAELYSDFDETLIQNSPQDDMHG
jgi:hypothetical protein